MNVWVLQFAYTAPSASGYLLLAWSLFTSGWWWTNKRHNYSLPSSCSSPHLSSIIYHHGDYICTTITFAPIQSLCSLCVGFATLVRFPNCRVPKASGLGNLTRALLAPRLTWSGLHMQIRMVARRKTKTHAIQGNQVTICYYYILTHIFVCLWVHAQVPVCLSASCLCFWV